MKARRFITKGVELIAFNDGFKTDINDNKYFCDKLEEVDRQSVSKAHLQEYFNALVVLYRMKDGSYILYYTVPITAKGGELVDGYIVQSNNPVNLFEQLAVSRNIDGDNDFIVKLIEYAVENGTLLKQDYK